MTLTKEQARNKAPQGWRYAGFWDNLYHYFTGKTGQHVNISCSEKQIKNGMLDKCCKRILNI